MRVFSERDREVSNKISAKNRVDISYKIGTFLPIFLFSKIMSTQLIEPILSPKSLKQELPIDPEIHNTVDLSRDMIRSMIHGNDDHLLVIVGPCSIHDPVSAIEYA